MKTVGFLRVVRKQDFEVRERQHQYSENGLVQGEKMVEGMLYGSGLGVCFKTVGQR